MQLPAEGYSERTLALAPRECRALVATLMDSKLAGQNQLSAAFEGSSGLQIVFTRSGLEELRTRLPILIPFFELSAASFSNAFFMNALIVSDRFQVKPHLDCSLNTFLPSHASPIRVSVLYLQVPDDLSGGALEIFNRSGVVAAITPREGLLVQFRGDLVHGIASGKTNSERISLVLEEYQLDDDQLGFIPDFSLQPALRRALASDEYVEAYARVRDFVQSLTDEERNLLRSLASDHAEVIDSNSSDR
jgi:hypothetical protein